MTSRRNVANPWYVYGCDTTDGSKVPGDKILIYEKSQSSVEVPFLVYSGHLTVDIWLSIMHVIDTDLFNENYFSNLYLQQTFIILMFITKFEVIYKSVRTRGFWHLCCKDQPQIQFSCITNTIYVTTWSTLPYVALFYVCVFTLILAKYWMCRIYFNTFMNTQITM